MTKLSVSVNAQQEAFINAYIKAGNAGTKAEVVRRALNRFAEDEAVDAVLQTEKEPTLHGDLRVLAKKIKRLSLAIRPHLFVSLINLKTC